MNHEVFNIKVNGLLLILLTNVVFLTQAADIELYLMETTPGEPTNDKRVGTITLESMWKLLHRYYHIIITLYNYCFSLSQDKFIQYLLAGTQQLTSAFALQNSYIMSHIINCSTGIFLLAEKKCDIQTNPNPTVSVTVTHKQ